MKFNDEIISAFAELNKTYSKNDEFSDPDRCPLSFVDDFIAHYEILKDYSPTYIFLDTHDEPVSPILAVEWIPSRIGFMMYSTNYRVVPLMEDIVHTLNSQHYLSTIVLSRALIEYAANINHYVRRLMNPTGKIMEINKKEINANNKDLFTKELVGQVFEVRAIVLDFLARSRPHFDPTKRTKMEKWQEKHSLRSPGVAKLIRELPNDLFFKKDPYDLYHILCNYTHPNSESNQLVVVEVQKSDDGTTLTLSRDKKNYIVLLGFLQLIYAPVLGSLRSILISLNQLNEILKVYKALYKL